VSSSLVLSLETIPDVPRIRQLFGLGSTLRDADVADYAFQRQRAEGGDDTLPFHLQRVVLVSCLRRGDGQIELLSLDEGEGEADLLGRLFALLRQLDPQIVAWEAEVFVRPLLLCRAMLHGIDAGLKWPQAENARVPFGDMASVPGLFDLSRQLRFGPVAAARSPLADFARLAGIPEASDPDAVLAWEVWCKGQAAELKEKCERRVLMNYLIFLRLLVAQGQIEAEQMALEQRLLRAELAWSQAAAAQAFIADWPSESKSL
jgi:predicted PolB exonuclease-like 3'-5' exonuclease